MKTQFVTYKIALKLKEVGFNENCIAYFDNKGVFYAMGTPFSFDSPTYFGAFVPDLNYRANNKLVAAPLWQQVIEWFSNSATIRWPFECWLQPYLSKKPRKVEAFYWRRGETVSVGVYKNNYIAREKLILKILELIKVD